MILLAALLAVVSVACFGDSFVCLNAFLPGVVQSAPEVVAALQRAHRSEQDEVDDGDVVDTAAAMDEQQALMSGMLETTADSEHAIDPESVAAYHSATSAATARISSRGVGIGYISGVAVLCLTILPVSLLGGSLFSLRLAVGISGLWWAVFSVPAAVWLPGGKGNQVQAKASTEKVVVKEKLKDGWTWLGGMMHAREIRRLRVTYWYLLAWALLSDGETRRLLVIASN